MRALLLSAVCLASCVSQATPPVRADIDAIVAPHVSDGRFAGVVLIGNADGVRHAGAYGTKTEGGESHALDSEWRWASVTKMLASWLVLQEVEAGKLMLDGNLSDILPDAPDTIRRLTPRQLLTHISGLADPELSGPDNGRAWGLKEDPDWSYCYGPPLAEPGERFEYNACDFIIIADVLRSVSGRTFPELVEERFAIRFDLPSLRIVTAPDDDAEIRGTIGGEPVERVLRLANSSAAAAAVGAPLDLLELTRRFMAGEIVDDPELRREFGRGNPDIGYVALGVWGFETNLPGCEGTIPLIERQGHLNGTKVLTLQSPTQRRSVVAFSNREETDWGWIWQGSGLTHDLATAAFCTDG